MRFARNLCELVIVTTLLAAFPLASLADQHEPDAHKNTVSARSMLKASVYNVGNPLGNVRDLVLSEDGTTVQYVIYEIPYPYAYKGARNGFAGFTHLDIERNAGLETVVRFGSEPTDQVPDRLSVTRTEADHRLLSRILNDDVIFSDRKIVRQVEDILIDRETGRITGFVVNKNPDAWFNDQPRVISSDQAKISEQGNVTTTADFTALASIDQ